MRIAVFSTKPYDRESLEAANAAFGHELVYFETRLVAETCALAAGFDAVCAFVNDQLNSQNLRQLHAGGTRHIALRCAGFNNVDLPTAQELGLAVVRVPAYSPHAIAEHTIGLMLTLNRKIHRAYNRVREGNFALNGLLGFDLQGKTAGIVGTGRIGCVVAQLLHGFGCRLLAYDTYRNPECQKLGVEYVSFDELLTASDIVTMHCPLTPETFHLIGESAIGKMRPGVMLINTSRGAVIDTKALIAGLKSGQLGAVGLDVYEEESEFFFEDLSNSILADDVLARLLTFPNVIVTGHQGFFTHEALHAIAATTLGNLQELETTGSCSNQVSV